MRPHKVVLLLVGSVAAVIGLALTAAGGALIAIHATQRDAAGYYTTPTHRFETPTFALTSEDINLGADRSGRDWGPLRNIGTARITVTSSRGNSIFVGIARHRDVEAFLAATAHDALADVSFDPFEPTYRRQPGEVPPGEPADQHFWVASSAGAGTQVLTWDLEAGSWDVVVMNADAGRDVSVDAAVAVKTGLLLPIGIGLLGAGLAAGAAAAAFTVLALRREDAGAVPAVAPRRTPVAA